MMATGSPEFESLVAARGLPWVPPISLELPDDWPFERPEPAEPVEVLPRTGPLPIVPRRITVRQAEAMRRVAARRAGATAWTPTLAADDTGPVALPGEAVS